MDEARTIISLALVFRPVRTDLFVQFVQYVITCTVLNGGR